MKKHGTAYMLFCSLSFFLLVPLYLLFRVEDCSAQYVPAYLRGSLQFVKRYTVYGSIELAYDRSWTQGSPATSTFAQNYNLGVRGFVVDPRLMNFDVSGIFTNVSGTNIEGFTLKGGNINAVFLEKLPAKWMSSWAFIPNPITLRFTHTSGIADFTNYGVTLRHGMPEEIKAQKLADNPDAPIYFPTTFFDYDKYKYTSTDTNTNTSAYSLRSFMTGTYFDYKLLAERFNQVGTTDYQRTSIELDPNYRFYNNETKRTLDIINLLRWDRINQDDRFDAHNRTLWRKPMGKDQLIFNGALDYVNLSATSPGSSTDFTPVSGTATTYSASGLLQYEKVYSPRLTNTPGVFAGLGKLDNISQYFIRAQDAVTADLSRVFRTSSSAFVGFNQNGAEYGVNANLYTKTRISTSLGYTLTSLNPDVGPTMSQLFQATAIGPLFRSLNFNTNIQYLITDASQTTVPLKVNALSFTTNLFWTIGQTSFTFGGTYSQATTKNDITTKGSITALQAVVSRFLTRRLFFNVYSTWTKDSLNKSTILDVRPRLSWSTGMTFVDLEYDYQRTTTDTPALTSPGNHRIFVRFVRNFTRDFYFR